MKNQLATDTRPPPGAIEELRADFEKKFLERFATEPNPLSPLKRRAISHFVQEWVLEALEKIDAVHGTPFLKEDEDGRST